MTRHDNGCSKTNMSLITDLLGDYTHSEESSSSSRTLPLFLHNYVYHPAIPHAMTFIFRHKEAHKTSTMQIWTHCFNAAYAVTRCMVPVRDEDTGMIKLQRHAYRVLSSLGLTSLAFGVTLKYVDRVRFPAPVSCALEVAVFITVATAFASLIDWTYRDVEDDAPTEDEDHHEGDAVDDDATRVVPVAATVTTPTDEGKSPYASVYPAVTPAQVP